MDDLLVQFQSITTNDHESLILQFSKVLQLNRETAAFFLESSNWNVETAINTYYTHEHTSNGRTSLHSGRLLTDLSALPQQEITAGQVVNMVRNKNIGHFARCKICSRVGNFRIQASRVGRPFEWCK